MRMVQDTNVFVTLNGNAGALVTFNTRDFQSPEMMLPQGLDIITPGAFVRKYHA